LFGKFRKILLECSNAIYGSRLTSGAFVRASQTI
jgi:hypothetical protein